VTETKNPETKGEADEKNDADTRDLWKEGDERGQSWEKKKETRGRCASLSHRSLDLSPRLFIAMPKDIQDIIKHLCNEVVLRILQLADEDMLRDSGNAVYLRMKRELDEVR
jgi:hypothetical protein